MRFGEMMDIVTDGHAVAGTIAMILGSLGVWFALILAATIGG